jgi:hypothetical protein
MQAEKQNVKNAAFYIINGFRFIKQLKIPTNLPSNIYLYYQTMGLLKEFSTSHKRPSSYTTN